MDGNRRTEMRHWLRKLLSNEQGISFVEYLIILGLVALVGFGAWATFGNKVVEKANEGTDKLDELDMGN